MLLQKDPLHMLGKPVDIRIHGSRVDAEIMEPSFAFSEALALDFDLEQSVAVVLIVFKGNELLSSTRFMNRKPSELRRNPLRDMIGLEYFVAGTAERIAVFR